MLTIAKMHGESVAYYESTVGEDPDENLGPDGYYSEDYAPKHGRLLEP
ncbi:hypothetical protein [Corynebacterium rouxii]|uniref:Uncharacterized protein n=1 Tax=Corynebacterium rouxii TaxID=2719119 RepID=A0A6I8M966_9CORY|nr:hypothetical protein [Corynebacterium rouxii]MDT9408118.1 hypothetical protein [Corynebacterium rouxii]MDT9410299.1 hypothetical protein [Corynebacterium rouxii]VZH84406.1 hypothetical protein FRC0190_00428 [Corynebacterium rouxii]